MPKPIRLYVRYVDATSDAVGVVTMYLIYLMIGVLLLDAVTRNIINVPQYWCIEVAQFTLAAYYIVGGAYSLRLGAHVRMDVLYEKFSERGKARIDAFTDLCMLFYLVCLLIGSVSSTLYAWRYGQTLFSMWSPSLVPIKIIMVCGIVLMILQVLSILFKDIARARGITLS